MIYSLFSVILPVLILVVSGYLSVHYRLFRLEEINGLLKICQNFALPVFLFVGMLGLEIEFIGNLKLLLSFYTGSVSCFLLGVLIFKIFLKTSSAEAIALAFCILFSNAVLLGLPITELAYGSNSIKNNLTIIAFNAPFCYTIGIAAMEVSTSPKRGILKTSNKIITTIISNPIAMSLIFGLIVNKLNIPIAVPIISSLSLIAKGALPFALFAFGGVLIQYKISVKLVKTSVILLLSLIIHPIITFLLSTKVFYIDFDAVRSATITAAMAPGLNAFIFCSFYNKGNDVAASAILLGTPFSLLITCVWLTLL